MNNNNQKSDANNPNKGTNGANTTYSKNQGNKGKQLNPNQNKSGKK
jgi:hypothetical protein